MTWTPQRVSTEVKVNMFQTEWRKRNVSELSAGPHGRLVLPGGGERGVPLAHVDGGGDQRLQGLAAPQVERVQEGALRLAHVTPHLQAVAKVKGK